MPGLAGCFTSEDRAPAGPADRSYSLLHEPYYRRLAHSSAPHAAIEVIDNGTWPELAGVGSHDGITAAYYGEFYNPEFDGMSGSDAIAERLVSLYRKHGDALPGYLDGSFIVAIFDGDAVLLFNDHSASRQAFYSFRNGCLYFAPEIKGLLHYSAIDRSVNEEAFLSFFVNGALSSGQSFYRQIRPLQPGSMVKVQNGECVESRYFHYRPNGCGKDLGEGHYEEALSEAMLGAVRRRMRRLDTMVVPLSGGIDSRGILGCIHRLAGGSRLKTVSWGFDETTTGCDARVARKVADLLGTEHHFIQRKSAGFESSFEELFYRLDGLTDDAWMHHSELGAVATIRCGLHASAIWRGEECFGHWPRPVSEFAARMNSGYHALTDHPELQRLFTAPVRSRFASLAEQDLRRLADECPVSDLTDRRDYWYYYERLFHYHTRGSYFKMTAVEVKSPWLDKSLLRLLESLPVPYRTERMLYKKALARLFPELMAIPPATATSIENWPQLVRTDPGIQGYLRHHLLESRNPLHDWLDGEAVRALLAAAFQPSAPAPKTGLAAAKNTLRRVSPALFNLTKSLAGSRAARLYPIPPAYLAMRLLCAKRWFDRFA